MKILKPWDSFKESIVNNVVVDDAFINESALSELQKKYRVYFKEMLKIYDVSSQTKLTKELKKEFFKNIRKYWSKGNGPLKTGEDLETAVNGKPNKD